MAAKFEDLHTDVLIVGSGPLGATYARMLKESKKGMRVFMIDAGPQLSPRPGWHLKNAYQFQRDVNQFTGVIKGHLHPLSVPTDKSTVPTLDPAAFTVDPRKYDGFLGQNQNPHQNPYCNLADSSATFAVGGMATHWTAATPREHKTIERSDCLTDKEWKDNYAKAEGYLKTNQTIFEKSIRNKLVKDTLISTFKAKYPDVTDAKAQPQNLPLAGERKDSAPEFVTWTGVDTILGDELLKELEKDPTANPLFTLKPSWQCQKLETVSTGTGDAKTVSYAIVQDLLGNLTYHIYAKAFVIAAGAVLTPQILFNSGIKPAALGKYLCEQPMAFCQIVLLQSLIDSLPKTEGSIAPNDPIPIPLTDPTPQCWIPVSTNRPWHCQVHRDAFSYGEVAPNIDTRLIVDLRWFGRVEPSEDNFVTFETDIQDTFGMPQPTFNFAMNDKDRVRAHDMMEDMVHFATALGGFLPGSEPSFQKPGLALHITGTCRMSKTDDGKSVVDTDSRVWKYTNLFIGSCGVIPTGTACNPTLSAMAMAIKSANYIIDNWSPLMNK